MWQPKASIATLKQRAFLLSRIRAFFMARQVLEVDVPFIGECSVTDPHLDALSTSFHEQMYYLQTSPEYYMKRLLSAGSGDIYYLGKACRQDETGRIHHFEFTILEWYRLGYSAEDLMHEVSALVRALKPSVTIESIAYDKLFQSYCGVNPHTASAEALERIAHQKLDISWKGGAKETWLDLLFTHLIEPQLNKGLVGVFDYPACQAALAQKHIRDDGVEVAKRFEFFLGGVELANGYFELADSRELRERFIQDNTYRQTLGKQEIPYDEAFLSAMDHGLPSCAGVALGVDRLVMGVLGLSAIHEQSSF